MSTYRELSEAEVVNIIIENITKSVDCSRDIVIRNNQKNNTKKNNEKTLVLLNVVNDLRVVRNKLIEYQKI